MKLGIIYHVPFWRTPDGALAEAEGSFARYVDSLAPYFDDVSICAPEQPVPGAEGTRIRAANVRLAPLPFFEGPRQFYPQLPSVVVRLSQWVREIDLLHCRVPTPAAFPAYLIARVCGVPVFLLVVGDLRGLLPTLTYRGAKRLLFSIYTAWEEFGLSVMTRRVLTFANGRALAIKHQRDGTPALETKTTTIMTDEIGDRPDTCRDHRIKLLCVSRVDPRKGLRVLPDVVARLSTAGRDVSLDIIGPMVGHPGEQEREAIEQASARLGVSHRLRFLGTLPLERLLSRFREYDLFVLPTLPGEGIPRVLLEAMAAGVPVVTTSVAGIPSLIEHERNGLLVDTPSPQALASALERLIGDGTLRRRVIAAGYDIARAHTLDRQAAWMMEQLQTRLSVPLRAVSRLA